MGAPTLYRWDDPSAPVFLAGRNGLREILLGCLVNGYGSKAAAGWSVAYDDWAASGNFSVMNGPQSGVLGLWHPGGDFDDYGPMLYVAEGMQGAYQPLNARSGAVAVTDLSVMSFAGAVDDGAHFASYYRTTNGMRWTVVATDYFAVLIMDRAHTGSGLFSGNPQSYFASSQSAPDLIAFGAVDTAYGFGSGGGAVLGNFFCVGGAYGQYLGFSNTWHGGYVPVSHLRYRSGNRVSVARYGMISPYAGLDYPAGEIDYLQLRPWIAYVGSSGGGSAFSGRSQYGRLPGLFGYSDIGRYRDQDDFDFYSGGVDSFNEVMAVAGRDCIYGVVGNSNPVLVSLSEGDW